MEDREMRREHILWAGLALGGAAMLAMLPKARMALRRLGGMTYRSGPADSSTRPAADPARGFPA